MTHQPDGLGADTDHGPEQATEPTWENVPASSLEPATKPPRTASRKHRAKYAPYKSPEQNSRDGVTLRLRPQWWWLLFAAFMTWAAISIMVESAKAGAGAGAYAFAILFILFPVSIIWFGVLFPCRLDLDAEGLTMRGLGVSPRVRSFQWSEIQSLRLETRSMGKSRALYLVVEPANPTAHETVDLWLGVTGQRRVERVLRAHVPTRLVSRYW